MIDLLFMSSDSVRITTQHFLDMIQYGLSQFNILDRLPYYKFCSCASSCDLQNLFFESKGRSSVAQLR
jgi:hypothetical protein